MEPDPDPRIEQGLLKTQHNDVIHAYETTVNYWYSAKKGFLVCKFKVGYTDIREYDARAETRLESFLQVLCSVAIPL